VAVCRVTPLGNFSFNKGYHYYMYRREAVLPKTRGASFKSNKGWHFYMSEWVAILRVTQLAVLRMTQVEILSVRNGGNFRYCTEC